jgi:hypothetical protein
MIAIKDITEQILQNCDITDSQNAGLFSICGLALRLRDLYKWEKGLEPWIEKDSSEILDWIGAKEQKWEELAEEDFKAIEINGSQYDPFDTTGINAVLKPYGFFYGAGYARSLKPTFFLAEVETAKGVKGHPVVVLGRELARDLLTLPALTQDNCILIRQESAKFFLWDQIFYIQKSGRRALSFALENFGLKQQSPVQLRRGLAEMVAAETDRYIYHELGELLDTTFDRDLWREVIATFPHTPIELLARTVKDLLADTNENGTLRYILKNRRTASLAFYVAFLEGLTKELFPEIIEAFGDFMLSRDWQVIDQAIVAGYDTASYHAEAISDIFQKGMMAEDKKWIESEMALRLLGPLGVMK